MIKQGSNAEGFGIFAFKHVTLYKKVGVEWVKACKIENEEIDTGRLKSAIVLVGGKDYYKFFPEEGTAIGIVEVAECPLTGKWALRGTLFGEIAAPGVQKVEQSVNFSNAINKAGGGSLTLEGVSASLTATVNLSLLGEDHGEKFWYE